ncbi:hypothetical protein, partial [Streptomyces noursei]|uniref:hypothetical protein n=1 Tax=Streptomyces noursei TaxID=1971 RepID=UPI001E5F6D61
MLTCKNSTTRQAATPSIKESIPLDRHGTTVVPAPTSRAPRQPGPHRSGRGTTVAGIGAGLLLIFCCAEPALIAAGVRAGIGAWLSSPWVIAVAVLLAAAVVAVIVRRRTRGDACCPPGSAPTVPAGRDRLPELGCVRVAVERAVSRYPAA